MGSIGGIWGGRKDMDVKGDIEYLKIVSLNLKEPVYMESPYQNDSGYLVCCVLWWYVGCTIGVVLRRELGGHFVLIPIQPPYLDYGKHTN